MLSNAYLLAKIGADTAENEQHFAENLPIGRRVADRCPATTIAAPIPSSASLTRSKLQVEVIGALVRARGPLEAEGNREESDELFRSLC